ncbi:hypothetical protein [Streptomyces sp. NPDC086023]
MHQSKSEAAAQAAPVPAQGDIGEIADPAAVVRIEDVENEGP